MLKKGPKSLREDRFQLVFRNAVKLSIRVKTASSHDEGFSPERPDEDQRKLEEEEEGKTKACRLPSLDEP